MEENLIKKNKWLYPVSFFYGTATGLRNKFFDWGLLQSKAFNIPIICVGNLAVGGTGKTPHTEYLIGLLKKDFKVAVLSRGYKRKTNGYVLATPESTANSIGDEPFQIKTKFPDIYVAVDKNRCHGIKQLTQLKDPEVEVVLLDDAFQHRYVQAGMNILLTDYHRLFCDDSLLPVGLLRESSHGKTRAHIVIVTKCPEDIKPIDFNIIAKHLKLYPFQQLYFSAYKYGNLIPLFPETGATERELQSIEKNSSILLLTGIASPVSMIEKLEKLTKKIDSLAFGDHHNFGKKDIKTITDRFAGLEGKEKLIITTEKDAARLIGNRYFPEELKPYIYALPIEIEILQNQQETFNKNIINYVRQDKRNSFVPKGKDAYRS